MKSAIPYVSHDGQERKPLNMAIRQKKLPSWHIKHWDVYFLVSRIKKY